MAANRDAILILLAGLCWSLSGIGVRLIEDANVWQIVLYRSISMSFFLGGVVYYMTGQNPIKIALEKGVVGWVCGFALVLSYVAGVYALQTTSVANTLLLFSTAPFQTAILARVFLGEIVRWRTWFAIGFSLMGVLIMVGGQDNQSHIFGDIAALSAALGFAVFTISVRKGRTGDMMPAVFWSGVLCLPVMVLICIFTETPLRVGSKDALIALLLGIIQMGLGLLLFTLGSKTLPAAKMTLLALSEVFFAPLWVCLFLDERIPLQTLIGGSVILLAIIWNVAGKNSQTELAS
ncbi:DMT family transporter [Paracoccaceae bacterium]|nr:DMT family transporter [Paracoccaceae bacterium]